MRNLIKALFLVAVLNGDFANGNSLKSQPGEELYYIYDKK
jgi:hypothetical protein